MADGRGEDCWSFRSVVIAELYNLTRSREDRQDRPFDAAEFNPYCLAGSSRPADQVQGDLDADDLAVVFGHGTNPQRKIVRPRQSEPNRKEPE